MVDPAIRLPWLRILQPFQTLASFYLFYNVVLGPDIILVRGMVKAVPDVAYHFCRRIGCVVKVLDSHLGVVGLNSCRG